MLLHSRKLARTTESCLITYAVGVDIVCNMRLKDIHGVMAAQTDLVEVLGKFEPHIVKMRPAGEGGGGLIASPVEAR